MSSVIVDRPVVTTPSSEWGSDPTVPEDRLSPRFTPTSYFRPASRSSPYSRPHPPTSGELEVPGAYPRDPRDALDDLSASAQDYDLRVQDFLPAKEDVQNVISNVSDAAMGAIGAVSAAGASLVAAASGEDRGEMKDKVEPTPMDNSVPFISNHHTVDGSVAEPDTCLDSPNAISTKEQPLIIPADLPSTPLLVPQPEGQIDVAPVAATSIAEETTLTSDDAADYVLFERKLKISETAIVPTAALASSAIPDDDVQHSSAHTGDYTPIGEAQSDRSLGVLNRSEPEEEHRDIELLANNASVDSLGSESGAGHGLGQYTSGDYRGDAMSSAQTPDWGMDKADGPLTEVNEKLVASDNDSERSPPVSRLHLAAGAVGVAGTAVGLIGKVAKRKDTVSSYEKSNDNETLATPIPSDIPSSPAIFKEEFAAQPPIPAPVGRPEIDNVLVNDKEDQNLWNPGNDSTAMRGVAAAPFLLDNNAANTEFEPSTHTPAPPLAPAPVRELSTLSSPAALAGENTITPQITKEQNVNVMNDTPDRDSSMKDKVSKFDMLAGAIGVAGVAAGLAVKAATRKPTVKTGEDANQFGDFEEKTGVNSSISSDHRKSSGIFNEDRAPDAPVVAGEYLTIPPSPNANEPIITRRPEEFSSNDELHSSTRSRIPIPIATYRSDGSALPEPGTRSTIVAGPGSFMSTESFSATPSNFDASNSTRMPACAVTAVQASTTSSPRGSGGMGANGLNVPDAHPPFVQLSTLPEAGEIVEPISTIEAPLGMKVHGESVNAHPGGALPGDNGGIYAHTAPAHDSERTLKEGNVAAPAPASVHPGYASSGSSASGQSYDEIVNGPNGPTTVRKKGKSKKSSALVEKMKEKLRF